MSYVALATDRFDEVVRFYSVDLGFPVIDQWDRPIEAHCQFHRLHEALDVFNLTITSLTFKQLARRDNELDRTAMNHNHDQ